MIRQLLTYGDRDKVPQSVMRTEIKKALDEQWEKLHFGHVINEVIPFLPLERYQIAEVS